jgi:glc operon protein GlcG
MSYGSPISLEDAKKVAAPALAEARKNNWNMAVAIVDPGGNLIYYEKQDNAQLGSANISIAKARSAALFKRPTKAFQDMLSAGGEGLRVLRLEGAVPIEGGIPLVMDGKIVGAIGVSGGTSAQDSQCAKAGADMLK